MFKTSTLTEEIKVNLSPHKYALLTFFCLFGDVLVINVNVLLCLKALY